MRELELEYRYLCQVELDARSAKVCWLEKLAHDLKHHLEEFFAAMLSEQKK